MNIISLYNVDGKKQTLLRIAWQKDGRIGKPNTRIWDVSRPSSNAFFDTSDEGQ